MRLIKKEDIEENIGYQSEPSPWFEVKQEQINQFADCTLDQQFIHVNPEMAKATPFGTTIAHGFLTLSMLTHLGTSFSTMIEGTYMGMNYGFDKVRFINPVKVGTKIRGAGKILDIVEKKPGQFMIKTEVAVEIEGEKKPALIAEWITMAFVK